MNTASSMGDCNGVGSSPTNESAHVEIEAVVVPYIINQKPKKTFLYTAWFRTNCKSLLKACGQWDKKRAKR
jgi:hypothetical protein